MALVSYDYSSGSENEEENVSSSTTVVMPDKKENSLHNNSTNKTENDVTSKSTGTEITENNTKRDMIIIGNNTNEDALNDVPELLTHLPQSKASSANIAEDKLEDFVPKYQPSQTKEKKSQKVKITIPSLSEFEDDDDVPEQKRRRTESKGSSLLAMLPPVRGTPLSTKSFVPNVVKNKQSSVEKKSTNNSLVPNAVRKKAELAKMAALKKVTKSSQSAGSDIESDDDIETPETFDEEMWQKVCGRRTKPKETLKPPPEENEESKIINIAPEPEKPYDGLDNAAFKELVGKAKKPVNIKLIDINEEEILSDKNLWLTKSLTDPDTAPKPAVENPVDPTRRKKHHITYLAEQAKANEQELQSQWAANKFTRNQTRAKYGF